MADSKNHRWVLVSRPKAGPLDVKDFRYEACDMPTIADGEFLIENIMLSFDASQRVWMVRDSYIPKLAVGDVVRALSVGKIVSSKNGQFPVDARVVGLFGWQKFTKSTGTGLMQTFLLPDGVSEEAALSVFGLTGMTGYFGMTEIGRPQPGDTVLVSGASGATGSIAAQVAKNMGARVIGIAGGEKKCAWLKNAAHLDETIDYKAQDVSSALTDLAPKGINVYYDNVGGTILDHALAHLAMNARVVLCGAISTYEGTNTGAISNYVNLVVKRASMTGFLVTDFQSRFHEAIMALATMIGEGKLAYEVDVVHGLENAPSTLQRLFDGKNMGKQLLRL